MRRNLAVLVTSCFALLAVICAALAHDHGSRYEGWLMSQYNKRGWSCCSGDDVVFLSDDEWGTTQNYRFTYKGTTYNVEDWQLLQPKEPNPTNRAVAWFWPHGELRCFAPGDLT